MKYPNNSHSDEDPSALSIEAAREKIYSLLPDTTTVESIALSNALGRVVAADVVTTKDIPGFRNSAMDGYAFRHKDAQSELKLVGKSLAGHPASNSLGHGECVRITTGARLPDEADTVVQQENVSVSDNVVSVEKMPEAGFHVRQIGSDCTQGEVLVNANSRVTAATIAVLVAHGITSLSVKSTLKVAIFSTGDELVDANPRADTAQIIDANRSLLSAILGNASVEIIDIGIVADDHTAIANAFERAQEADAVISSGGASVGDADFIKAVLAQRGEMHMWKVAMKPGRPLVFGLLDTHTPYFGLPGNPVSAAVTCLQFVMPSLDRMLGLSEALIPHISASMQSSSSKLPGRVEFQRGVLSKDTNGAWIVDTAGMQDSHRLSSLQKANCLIELPNSSAGVSKGDIVQVIPYTLFANSPV